MEIDISQASVNYSAGILFSKVKQALTFVSDLSRIWICEQVIIPNDMKPKICYTKRLNYGLRFS